MNENPVWAARETSEIPLYAAGLTPEEKKVNELFLEEMDRSGSPRSQNAKHAIMRGWQYLNDKHDPLMAIKRFNQAWLLDPNNANVYWGLGAAQGALGEYQDGINLISRASKIDKNNSEIITDIGRCYMFWGASTKDDKLRKDRFNKAIGKYQEALKVNPKSGYTYSNLAYASFYNGKYTEAWQMVKKAHEYGGKPDQRFISDLAAKAPEPK